MARKKSKYYVRQDGLHEAIRIVEGKRVAFRGKTDAEVERKMLQWHDQQKERTRFAKVADEWWEQHEPTLAYNTARNYGVSLERAKDHFGRMLVSDITSSDIEEYIKDFAKADRSRKVVTTQLQIIRQIMSFGVLRGYIAVNPAREVKPPRNLPKAHRMPPTRDEIKLIKENKEKHLLPFLIYETGCRRGEAFGLKWEDIDRKKKLIHISRSVYYVGTTPHIKLPKTASGIRSVPLLDALDAVLPKKFPKGYIFTPDKGKSPLPRRAADRVYEAFQKETGAKCTAHQIRHGYATALQEAGIDMKIRQELLGHAQLSTTMDIYTHIREDTLAEAAQAMNASF